MDDLPPPIITHIMSRLGDSADLARCRVASKALNSLSREVRFVNLQCSFDRYMKSRSPDTRSSITPFKNIFRNLISDLKIIEEVSIGVAKPLHTVSYDDVDDEDDDLYLTDVDFVKEWLPAVGQRLKSVSISDFWVQSCWRRSHLLALISQYCQDLVELEVRNAWLSVDGLNPMAKLTSLTLEYIRLDDENLSKVNECFPHLRVLNLIGVGGLREPMIHLLQLKSCQWSVSNAPYSVTVIAPKLITLKLKCVKPKALVIEAPLLLDFHLSIEGASNFRVQEFCDLGNLHLESSNYCNLFSTFPFGKTIKHLSLGSINREEQSKVTNFSFDLLLGAFPNVNSLTLTPGHWFTETLKPETQMNGLKKLTVYLVDTDNETALLFIFSVLEKCHSLLDVAMLIHRDAAPIVTSNLMSRCISYSSTVRWRWGLWKQGAADSWI